MATAARTPSKRRRPKARQEERENPSALEAEEVVVEIEDLDSFNESVNIMIHGPSGHGKTVLAGGAPNATFLSTEKGVVAAQRAGSKAKLIRTPTWEHVVAGKRKLDDTLGPEDWAIVDSITKMQVLMLRWILKEINKDNPSRDLDIPAIQDHQKWQNYFKRFVDGLVDAPYNTIFVATTMLREDEEGEDQVLPAITGKGQEICDYVCAQMDVNLYYALSDKTPDGALVRRALAQPIAPFVRCKDRYDVLGRYVDVPDRYYGTMADIIVAIQTGEPLVYEDDELEDEEEEDDDE